MKKWAIWKTISVVVASIMFVSGITILGVYLATGFKSPQRDPQSISFVVDDQSLYNSKTGQFEVTQTFDMTVQGERLDGAEITNTRVQLALDGEVTEFTRELVDQQENAYQETMLSNKIVVVPKFVTLNEPFKVEIPLSTKDFNEEDIKLNGRLIPWVRGGISSISASVGELSISEKIAVDTPVLSMTVKAVDLNGNPLKNLTKNERFVLQTEFYPANSAYLFNDVTRSKRVYFESLSNNLTTRFDTATGTRYFEANTDSDANEIVAYTFTNSKEQIEQLKRDDFGGADVEDDFKQTETQYIATITYLKTNLQEDATSRVGAKQGRTQVDIKPATIEEFSLQDWHLPNMEINKDYVIGIKESQFVDGYLNATIRTSGGELTSMLPNIAIAFEYRENASAPWQNAGDHLVVKEGVKVDYTKDGRDYYFANTGTWANYNNAYWTIMTSNQANQEFRLVVVLFEDENTIYAEDGIEAVYYLSLNAIYQEDKEVAWANSDDITIPLDFDGSLPEGEQITPRQWDMTGRTYIPAENKYKTVMYFAYFRGQTTEYATKILGNVQYVGDYTIGNQRLRLYPIEELVVYDVGTFDLYFATIRVDDRGDPEIVNGQYSIVQAVANPVHVTVTKTLYEGSVTDLKASVTGVEADEEIYYINEGSSATITLDFTVQEDSWQVFADKIADDNIALTLYDRQNNLIDQANFFIIGVPSLNEEAHTVSYTISVRGTFSQSTERLQLWYAQLQDLENTKLIWRFQLNENYIFYTPRAQDLTLQIDGFTEDEYSQEIKVKQGLQNGDRPSLTISFVAGGAEKNVNSIEDFLELFKVTIKDQHNKESVFENDWEFVTDNSRAIVIVDDGHGINFPTTEGEVDAKLWVKFISSDSLRSAYTLNFKITASGIYGFKFDESKGIGTGVTSDIIQNTNVINIEKYGAASGKQYQSGGGSNSTIDFANLIELYLNENTKYESLNYKYKFTSQYLFDTVALSDQVLIDLYGEDGMLTLVGTVDGQEDAWAAPERDGQEDQEYATALRHSLATLCVKSITFNHNFMSARHVINFNITDVYNSGVVDLDVNFAILGNISTTPSTAIGSEQFPVYAASKYYFADQNLNIPIEYINDEENHVSAKMGDIILSMLSQLGEGEYYAVTEAGENLYKLTKTTDKGNIGYLVANEQKDKAGFEFVDFWNNERAVYRIMFYFEGVENQFAPCYTFTVTVGRNIVVNKVDGKKFTFTSTDTEDNKITTYINVSRKEESDIALPQLTYTISDNTYIKEISNEQIIKTDKIPVFKYNQQFFEYKVSVMIGSALIEEVDINFYSGIEYQDIANRLTTQSSAPRSEAGKQNGNHAREDVNNAALFASTEVVDEVTYVKVSQNRWYLYNDNTGFLKTGDPTSTYRYTLVGNYRDNSSGTTVRYAPSFTNLYNPSTYGNGSDQSIQFSARGPLGLFGIGDNDNYLVVRVSSGDDLMFVMCVPVIVSRIGMLYGIYNNDTLSQIASIEDMTNPDYQTLIEQNKFGTVAAGKLVTIASSYSDDVESLDLEFNKEKSGIYYLSNQTTKNTIDISPVFKYIQVKDGANGKEYVELENISLASIVPTTDDERKIQLKDLVGNAANQDEYVYILITATISGTGYSQTFYYILKVAPNTVLEDVVYPYAEDAEYLSVPVGQTSEPIMLDDKFDQTTLHNDEERFNLKINSRDVDNSKQKVKHVVKSITTARGELAQDDWQDYIDIVFDDDARSMTVTPKQQITFTVAITRIYENIVGGQIDYTFIVNHEGSSYTLKFDDNVKQDGQNYSITLTRQNEQNKYADILINYVNVIDEGDNTTEIEKHDVLQVKAKDGDQNKIYASAFYNNKEQAQTMGADEQSIPSNTLRINYLDYLDQKQDAEFYIYSMFGYLGTLKVTFEGTVSYKADQTTLAAGASRKINSLFKDVSIYGESVTEKDDATEYTNITEEEKKVLLPSGYQYSISNAVIDDQTIQIDTESFKARDLIFYTAASKTLTVRASAVDFDASITITLKIYTLYTVEVQTKAAQEQFTFTLPLHITKNLTYTNGAQIKLNSQNDAATEIRTVNIQAGTQIKDIDVNSLFSYQGDFTNTTVKYTWTALTGGEAFDPQTSPVAQITISTNQVAFASSVVALIKVYLYNSDTLYQSFYVKYQFVVEPSVIITTNRPIISGSEQLDFEYINDGESFDVLSGLINGQAPFATQNRFVVKTPGGETISSSSSGRTWELKVVSISNATVGVWQSASAKFTSVYSTEEGNNVLWSSSSNGSTKVTFKIGTWKANETTNTNNGDVPSVTVQLKVNEVYKEYTFRIVENKFSLAVNRVARNSQTDVETFYVETLTQSNKIFEEARLLNFNLIDSARKYFSGTSLTLTALFETQTDGKFEYTSVPFDIYSTNIGGVAVNVDLGQSYAQQKLIGIFNTTPKNIAGNTTDQMSGTQFFPVNSIEEELFGAMPQVISRVELRYNGQHVDFAKYSSQLQVTGTSIANYAISTTSILTKVELSDFKYGDVEFELTYSYQLDVDIAVQMAVEFSSSGVADSSPVNNLEVRQQFALIRDFQVKHPSNDTSLKAEELKGTGAKIELEVVGLNSSVTSIATTIEENALKAKYGDGILTPYNIQKENNYLDISALRETGTGTDRNEYIVDYNIVGLGAGNGGNYVALKLTYTVTVKEQAYPKTFYIVVRVMPDYTITYSGAPGVDLDENGYYVNQLENEIYRLNSLQEGSDELYTPVNVAGGSGNNIVTVVHKNGTDRSDYAARNFDYYLNLDYTVDQNVYNNSTNVDKKLSSVITQRGWGNKNTSSTNPTTNEATDWYCWQNVNNELALSLSQAKIVNFASQSYRLEAVDAYGYRFGVCFNLESVNGEVPFIADGAYLNEGRDFDLGVEYNALTVNEDGVNQISLGGTDNKLRPTGADGVSYLLVQNVAAYGFDKPLTVKNGYTEEEQNYSKYFTFKDGAWALKDDKKWVDAADSGTSIYDAYMKHPIASDLRVVSIGLYFENKSLDITLTPEGGGSTLKTSPNIWVVDEKAIGDKYKQGEGLAKVFKMPQLPSYIYKDGNEAAVEFVVRFGYNPQVVGPETTYDEYYDLHVLVNVRKNIVIATKSNNFVQDDVPFKVADYLDVRQTENTDSTPIYDYTVYDDTLAVYLKSRSSNIALTLSLDGQEKTALLSNDYSYDRVEYISLSDALETTLTKSSQVNVKYDDNKILGVKYNNNSVSSNTPITLTSIENDTINIEDSLRLNSNKAEIRQYYLVSLNANDKIDATRTVEYRHTMVLNVTGHYNSIHYDYSGDRKPVSNYIEEVQNGKSYYTIPIEAWTENMYLTRLVKRDGQEFTERYDTFSPESLKYLTLIVKAEGDGAGGSGDVEIDRYGTIKTGDNFDLASHYISVVVRQKVSGWNEAASSEYDYNLTSDAPNGIFAFRLTSSGRETADIASSSILSGEEGNKLLTVVNRYLQNGEYVYSNKIISISKDATNVNVKINHATFAAGEFASDNDTFTTINIKYKQGDGYTDVDWQANKYNIRQGSVTLLEGVKLYTIEGSVATFVTTLINSETILYGDITADRLKTINDQTYIKVSSQSGDEGQDYYALYYSTKQSSRIYPNGITITETSLAKDEEISNQNGFTAAGTIGGYNIYKYENGLGSETTIYFLQKKDTGLLEYYTLISNFAFLQASGV